MEQIVKKQYDPYIRLKLVQAKSGEYALETVNQPIMYTGSVGVYRLEIDVSVLFLENKTVYAEYLRANDTTITQPLTLTLRQKDGVYIATHKIPRVVLNSAGTKAIVISVKQMKDSELATVMCMQPYLFDVYESGASLEYENVTNVDNLQSNINALAGELESLQASIDNISSAEEFVNFLKNDDCVKHLKIKDGEEVLTLEQALSNGVLASKINVIDENGTMHLPDMSELVTFLRDRWQEIYFDLYQIKIDDNNVAGGKIFDSDKNIILKSTDLADANKAIKSLKFDKATNTLCLIDKQLNKVGDSVEIIASGGNDGNRVYYGGNAYTVWTKYDTEINGGGANG